MCLPSKVFKPRRFKDHQRSIRSMIEFPLLTPISLDLDFIIQTSHHFTSPWRIWIKDIAKLVKNVSLVFKNDLSSLKFLLIQDRMNIKPHQNSDITFLSIHWRRVNKLSKVVLRQSKSLPSFRWNCRQREVKQMIMHNENID